MSLGFNLSGTVKSIEKLIKKAEAMADKQEYDIDVQENEMTVSLCPVGDIEISWEKNENNNGRWRVEADCRTTPAGPGFHKAALEFAENLGIKELSVYDETDYYSHRDFERLKDEHFYGWLDSLINICCTKYADSDCQVCICWNMKFFNPEDVGRTIVTPMGRFSVENTISILEEEGIEGFARLILMWNNEERDALFYRNRALYGLWMNCYFAPSDRSEEDKDINRMIIDDLEKAYNMDDKVPIPYEAYLELCELDGSKPDIPDGCAKLFYGFPVGYRKGLVTESIRNLRLVLPGSYQYEWEEDEGGSGTHLWWDVDEESPVWRVSVFRARNGQTYLPENTRQINDMVEKDIPNGQIRYGWNCMEEDGETLYIMEAEVASCGYFYLITVAYTRPEEKDGIVELIDKISAVNTQ